MNQVLIKNRTEGLIFLKLWLNLVSIAAPGVWELFFPWLGETECIPTSLWVFSYCPYAAQPLLLQPRPVKHNVKTANLCHLWVVMLKHENNPVYHEK